MATHTFGMTRLRATAGLVAVIAFGAGCRTSGQPEPAGGVAPQGATGVIPQGATGVTPAEQARAEIAHPRYTAAGVQFTSGMIGHHAQAILMSQWAPTHGTSPAIQSLADRIIVSQTDEIKFMQDWLRARKQVVPPSDPRGYVMPGMTGPMLMPGMLTPEQMAALDRSRGAEFDRLFLGDMIVHHQGAIGMVQQLTSSGEGGGEDDALMTYAANVAADQAAEIGRMARMLNAMRADSGGRGPARE
jgi:uncharacterized protein (DUF305 family)